MNKWHLHIPEAHELDDPERFDLAEMQKWARGSWTFWVNGCVHQKFKTKSEADEYYNRNVGCWDCEIALLNPKLQVSRLEPKPQKSKR